jgi:hypothetical protein
VHLPTQAREDQLSHPTHDAAHLADQRAEAVAHRAGRLVGDLQPIEEPLRAALHGREDDALLGTEVMVDGARRDAGLLDERGDRGRRVAVLCDQPLGGVEDRLARAGAAPVGSDVVDPASCRARHGEEL